MDKKELANKLRTKIPNSDKTDEEVISMFSKKYPKIKDMIKEKPIKTSKRKFIVVTKDFAGLGFAIQEINKNGSKVIVAHKLCEKFDEKELEAANMMGKGLVKTVELDKLFDDRESYREYYWIWDGNHNADYGEILISEGFKVWGGTKFTDDLEHDRGIGVEFAESCGLVSPPTMEFTSAEEGISFMEQNEDKAYVMKPNDLEDNSLTYVPMAEDPHEANEEVRNILEAYSNHEATSSYILQEMVQGVEVNIEAFFVNGEAYFAHANFEDKFSHQKDSGEATGCAFDLDFEIPRYSRLYLETVGKMEPALKEMGYTGLADANIIVSDDNFWFLEFCFRLGYNAAVNFFYNLANKTCLQTLADMVDGIKDIKSKSGFGASMTVFTEKYKTGLPISYPEKYEDRIFLFDGYKENDIFKMAGIGHEILIINEHNYTIKTALKDVVDSASRIVFKNCYFRRDADENNYKLSPENRYAALVAMKML